MGRQEHCTGPYAALLALDKQTPHPSEEALGTLEEFQQLPEQHAQQI